MSHLRCWTSKPLRGFPAHVGGVMVSPREGFSMTDRDEFSAQIQAAIQECYEIGYPPTRFEEMIRNAHPVEVARRLVLSGDFQDGFRNIVGMGRQDLTVEYIMLRPEFSSLFTPQEIQAAQWRLQNV